MADDFKAKLSGKAFVEKLMESGFTEKTIEALRDEDVNSDASLRILSEKDLQNLAEEKRLTIGQKRLLIEFAASLRPNKPTGNASRRNDDRRRGRDRSRSPMSNRRRHEGDRDRPEPSTCIGVFNLPLTTNESSLRDIFSHFGHIKDVRIVTNKMTGESRGFGFVYFEDLENAINAKESLAGISVEGKTIRTEFSITDKAHSPTPGNYLGRSSRGRGSFENYRGSRDDYGSRGRYESYRRSYY